MSKVLYIKANVKPEGQSHSAADRTGVNPSNNSQCPYAPLQYAKSAGADAESGIRD